MLDKIAAAIRTELEPAIFFDGGDDDNLKNTFFGGSRNGFFVEVGAYDPVRYSQTWPMEQRGWIGVLVEPNPEKAGVLRRERRAAVYDVACSSRANSGKLMPFHVAGMFSSLLSESVTAQVVPTHQITVRTRTLDDILTDANAPSPIDFISIDVEGHDLEVLDGLDLDRWRPRLLVVEDLAMNLGLHRHLSARGYRWIRRVALNAWYVPAEHAGAVSWFGRWQFFRKYYLSVPFRHLREWKRRIFGNPIPPENFDRGPVPR